MQISLKRLQPLIVRLRPYADVAMLRVKLSYEAIKEHPRYIRSFCLLPLLVTWFAGIHSGPHKSAAHRGLLLSIIYLLASWLVYLFFDTFRVMAAGSFAIQAVFFFLQTMLSLAYIVVSLRMAHTEYSGKEATSPFLDRWRERIVQFI